MARILLLWCLLTASLGNALAFIPEATATLRRNESFRHTQTNWFHLPQSVGYTYDFNENLVSDGLHGFDYDSANQLVRITVTNGWKSEFAYDGFGRRRVRREFTWQNRQWVQTNEVRYVWLGMTVIQERDGANRPVVDYAVIGDRLARKETNRTAYYTRDLRGNVTALFGSAGEVLARYTYDPFGNVIAKSGPMADVNTYRFSGEDLHVNSGLYYYGFRLYNPRLQRWMNRDPIGLAGGINMHGFVGNDPINRIDPLGLDWTDWAFFQWWERVTRPLRGLNPDGSQQNPLGNSTMMRPQDDTMGLQPSLLGDMLLPGGGFYMSGAGTSRCAAKALTEAAARRKAAELAEALAKRDLAGTALSVATESLELANSAYRQAMQDLEYAGREAGMDSAPFQTAVNAWRAAQGEAANAARNYQQAVDNWVSVNNAALNAGR